MRFNPLSTRHSFSQRYGWQAERCEQFQSAFNAALLLTITTATEGERDEFQSAFNAALLLTEVYAGPAGAFQFVSIRFQRGIPSHRKRNRPLSGSILFQSAFNAARLITLLFNVHTILAWRFNPLSTRHSFSQH